MSDELETFLANLEEITSSISSGHCDFVLLIGDFNAKSRNWSNHDKATTKGTQLDLFDLVFINKPDIVLDYGVRLSPHPNCYHQIIYFKT